MNDAAKRVICGFVVFSGAVFFEPSDSRGLFADESGHLQTQGAVIWTTYFSIKLDSERDGLVTFYLPEKDVRVNHEVGKLQKGDQVTIRWSREAGHNWVRNVTGPKVSQRDRQCRGVVVATTYFSVKLQSEEDGLVTFYLLQRDAQTRHRVNQLRRGDQVTIRWDLKEKRKWVRDIAPTQQRPSQS